jgi:hypothetical protein
MSFHVKRPKRLGEENEDDLMRFQEEFLKNKSTQPAATVVKKQKQAENESNSMEDLNGIKKDKMKLNQEKKN